MQPFVLTSSANNKMAQIAFMAWSSGLTTEMSHAKTKAKRKPEDDAALAPSNGYAPILVMPLNTAPETVAEARGCGYLPVLADDPTKVMLVLPMQQTRISGDVMMAAMTALTCERFHLSDAQSSFVMELQKRLLKHEGA